MRLTKKQTRLAEWVKSRRIPFSINEAHGYFDGDYSLSAIYQTVYTLLHHGLISELGKEYTGKTGAPLSRYEWVKGKDLKEDFLPGLKRMGIREFYESSVMNTDEDVLITHHNTPKKVCISIERYIELIGESNERVN